MKLSVTKRLIVFSLAILMLDLLKIQAAPKKPQRDAFGLRLGMNEESVRRRIRKIATQQKEERGEEEGEREVWIVRHDSNIKYLVTQFDRNHKLMLLTIVAHANRVRYSDIASLKEATKATDGINYSYKWRTKNSGQERDYLIIARGNNSEFLTSYSFYLIRRE
jgi:hypothetical protein